MNDYFVITEAVDSKVIGPDYPQCTGLLKGYNNEYENPLSLYFFAHQKGLQINFVPDLSSIKIGSRTKLTDLISCSLGPGNDYIISSRFKELIGKYRISPIQFFDCFLHRRNERFKYCWAHFIYALEKSVDYVESDFSHADEKLLDKISAIKSYPDFLSFYDNDDTYGFIRSTRTVIRHEPLDFFVVGRYNQKHYVSKRFKEELLESELSGIEFSKASDIFFV